MAFFDKRELVDVIRHEIRIEDESGIAARVVRPASKRAKYGGLPLNFRTSQSEDDDEEMDTYEIPLYEETVTTRGLISSRLRSRTVNSDQINCKEDTVDFVPSTSLDLFTPKPIVHALPSESLVSKYLQLNIEALRNPLNEYAVFEASSTGPSKRILILFIHQGEETFRHEVCVLPTVRVYQVIAFCHYKYYQVTSKQLPGTTEEYELFMAEETGEVDSDFPSLERGRVIGELGFPVLALVRTKDETSEKHERRIMVYFPDGPSFLIAVPSEDLPFSWLVDEALRRKEEQEGDMNPAIIRIREYSLEAVDEFDSPLDLTKSIGTSASAEFVMIRKNSSRGNFHPRPNSLISTVARPRLLISQRSQIMSPKSPGLASPRRHSKPIFEFPMEASTPLSPLPNGENADCLSCFKVERLHKYKPRWTANLLFHWDELEISPFASDTERRKSFLPQQYQKSIHVPWDFVCDVAMQEKEKAKESVHILTISWLPMTSDQGATLNALAQDSTGLNWKSVQVECRSREDAIEIHRYVASVIQTRQSPTQQAWMFSLDGKKTPTQAAEGAFGALQSTETASVEMPKMRKKSRFEKMKRFSRILDRRQSTTSQNQPRLDSP